MGDIHRIIQTIRHSQQKFVLATVIRVQGSAYRKSGACMLLAEEGTSIGMVTGGCLETDLATWAQQLYGTGKSVLLRYDLSSEDDLSWGQGAGCNGVLHILLESVDDEYREHLLSAGELLEQGQKVAVFKTIPVGFENVEYAFQTELGEVFGKGTIAFNESLVPWNRNELTVCGILESDESMPHRFWQILKPKPRLWIFGAGADARPLSALASRLGFRVFIWDWRPDWCSPIHFPEADQLWVGAIEATIPNLAFLCDDCAVLMTHHFMRDKELIHRLKQNSWKYFGVLGPRRRTERLLNHEPIPDCIASPVGLPIRAEGPEEIAVSIMAEMIKQIRS